MGRDEIGDRNDKVRETYLCTDDKTRYKTKFEMSIHFNKIYVQKLLLNKKFHVGTDNLNIILQSLRIMVKFVESYRKIKRHYLH